MGIIDTSKPNVLAELGTSVVQMERRLGHMDSKVFWSKGVRALAASPAASDPSVSFFNQRPWLRHSLEHLTPPYADVWVLSFQPNSEREIVVPFQLMRERIYGITGRVLRPVGDPMADRFDLSLTGDEWKNFVRALFLSPFRWDAALIGETSFTYDLQDKLTEFTRSTGATSEFRLTGQTPQIDLTQIDPEDPRAIYSKKLRARLRRNDNRIKRYGGVEYEFIDAACDTDELFDRIARIEAKSWKVEGNAAVFNDRRQRQFLKAIAQDKRASMKSLVGFAVVGGQDAAYSFSFVSKERLLDYQGSFAKAYSSLGIGVMLTQALIEHCVCEGVQVFDSSRSSINHVPVQAIFPHTMRSHHRCYLYNKTLPGRALSATSRFIRPSAKKLARKLQKISPRKDI